MSRGGYRRPHRWAWWMERPGYMRFMIRELTSVVIGAYLVLLVFTLGQAGGGDAGGGQAQLAAWLQVLAGPGWMVAHASALVAAVWHSVTWFGAVPQAMPIFLGEKRLSAPVAMIVMGYGPWLTVSAVVVWWMLR